MSHLSLDARAILEYLNELGYRNITAVQLKEFMKGMQPHSEVPSTTTSTKKPTTTRNPITSNPKSTSSNHINLNSHPSQCKLVKGKEPLVNFHFYLDIKDHQILKKIEERITELGGNLEFFLTTRVTHFITDRSLTATDASTSVKSTQNGYNRVFNSPSTTGGGGGGGGGGVSGGGTGGGGGALHIGLHPITPSPYYTQSPQTPATPQTPYTNHTHSGDSATDGAATSNSRLGGVKGVATTPNHKKTTSRADAMLHRALQSQQQTQQSQSSVAPEDDKRPNLNPDLYAVWHLDYAIRFLKRVTADLKQYLKKSHSNSSNKGGCEPIILKGHFIKIESIKRSTRPYYSVFRKIDWPKVHFSEDGGAFRLTPKGAERKKSAKDKPSKTNAMTRKSRSSSKHNHNHMRLKAKQQSLKQTEKPATIDNSSEKQCGVCEICKIEYDTLTIHLKTKDHEFFARNQNNYLALDTLIKSSANVNSFLDESAKNVSKEELIDSMDADEEVTRQTRQSTRIQTPPPPPPPLKIKTKLKEVETTTVDKKPTNNNVRKPAKSTVPLDSPPIRHPLPTSTIYKVVEDSKPVAPQTPSIIVKFRKIRQTELSILNGEAENFMFPKRPASSEYPTDSDRQTSTDSNRVSSSSISSESHSLDDREKTDRIDKVEQVDATTATNRRKTIAAVRRLATVEASSSQQSFQSAPIQPNRTSKLTKTVCETISRQNSVTPKPKTRRRRRNRVIFGGRRRTARSGRQPKRKRCYQRCPSEDRMGENITDYNDDDDDEDDGEDDDDDNDDDYTVTTSNPRRNTRKKISNKKIEIPKKVVRMKIGPPAVDISQGRVYEQRYSFERIPFKELWYEVFSRQDSCQERMFEYWGSTSYRKLPYEMGAIPIRSLPNCKICTPVRDTVKKELKDATSAVSKSVVKRIKKEKIDERSKSNTPDPDEASKSKPRIRNKHLSKATFLSYDLMPRKSPREHASTLAILSCLIKQRQDSELDEAPPLSPPLPKDNEIEKTVAAPKSSRTTPSPAIVNSRVETPEPMQFVSEISENVKRLRRGQRKFEDFIPTKAAICPVNKKPRKPKAGLEFELDEKRLKSLDAKQKSAVELEHEIDVYLGRTAKKSIRLTPPPSTTDTSSGFVDDFSTDVDLIDLIDCYDGGGGGGGGGGEREEENSIEHTVCRPASSSIFSFFSAHNRRRKNIKVNRTGWPKKRRNVASRQNLLLRRPDRFRYFCDYQTRQKNRLLEGNSLVTTSMTPPDTDLDDKDECTRSSVPAAEEVAALTPLPVDCKDESLNNGYMSPSEKADNSDIFTVSSDGLETDLDVSSSQIKTEDIDDECTTSSTIAVPPATPDPPPPPKSQSSPLLTSPKPPVPASNSRLIKKEVKVSCKRLRTPFRRFRQRR